MELSNSISYHNWTVKYGLYDPADSPSEAKANQPTAVFVHGTPWSSDVFQPIAKALLARKRYRVLLYDLPGYGQSQQLQNKTTDGSKFAGDTSVKAQASALAELLKHLQLDGKDGRRPPTVIAHDIAGTIALRTHLIHGLDFDSMVLLDTNTVLPWGDGFYKLARSEPDTFLKLPSSIFETVVRGVIRSACHNPNKLLSGWEDALARPWIRLEQESDAYAEEKQRSFIRQIAQANDQDVAEMLDANMYEKVRCDVKILWGENDQWIPGKKMEQLAGMLGERLKEFVTIPEAGHLCMIDQPERVAIELFIWLAEHS